MRIKIIANPKKDWAKALAREVGEFVTAGSKHQIVSRGAEATICVGGDGTILYANHKGRLEGAVLGIGSNKSYICQLHKNDWRGSILHILESESKVSVMMLEGQVGGKTIGAINDFVVHATRYRVVELDVETNGNRSTFEGDGIIFSSAMGSTSYAYSAGGEKFGPLERKILVVPICPHRRTFSPLTLAENATASVTVGRDCAFIVDGVFVRKLKAGERLSVKKGKDMIFFGGVGRNV